ncbi:hypothetical protein [Mangrovibacterium lignilyticum]|uniref:hypothetical protein n=1 Tax=Mangrovibacterium lignilyticum TaxID=2668052 RepID=UPI0013D6E57A|nr:hypothetical protein [Mangrovibacterium lignilyticum]
MKIFMLIGLFVCCGYGVRAQEKANRKAKVYKTWIKLNDSSQIVTGVLYEVGDSSLFVAGSLLNPDLREYRFSKIDLLKVRRDKSIIRGAAVGSVIGGGTGVVTGLALAGDAGLLTGAISASLGLGFAVFGGAVGIVAGSIKDRFPLNRSFENLEKYRSPLQNYSFLQEEIVARHKFEHKVYMGFSAGLSFARDELAFDVPFANYKGMERTGFSSKTILGYRITEQIGVSLSMRADQYATVDDDQADMYWNLDAFTAGPVLSLPLSEKFRFDFSPAIGFASASLYADNEEIYTGGGFAVNITGALVYDMSKRWVGSFSSGYLSSKQEYKEGGSGKANAIDIQLGLAYKFGKRSL